MVVAELVPRGPYSLRLSARFAGDATRRVVDGVLSAAIAPAGRPERVSASQRPDGTVCVRAETDAGLEQARFMLAVDDDHSEFLRRFADDPLLAAPISDMRGLRPLRTGTVAHALLRAVCGQLITAREARALERRVVVAASARLGELHLPPTGAELGRFSPAQLGRLGVHGRRATTLVRVCREVDLEGLRDVPTELVARRLERERGLGPWSVGVVCLQGLGRSERGLARDLGLVKLASELAGRRVEAAESDALLEPYGDWAGLASVYLLAGYHAGPVGLGHADRDPRDRQDRRVAPRRAA